MTDYDDFGLGEHRLVIEVPFRVGKRIAQFANMLSTEAKEYSEFEPVLRLTKKQVDSVAREFSVFHKPINPMLFGCPVEIIE